MKEYSDYSLLEHNTFGIDARCRRFVEYVSVEEAVATARLLRDGEPWMAVGAGSNLLLTRDYDGTVVHSAIMGKSIVETYDGTATLRCGSGETWDDVVAWTVELGFADLADLSLIPGEVGASAVQNIGAYGAEAGAFIKEVQAVEVATGQHVVFDAADCGYGYRYSRFKDEWKDRYLITHVSYQLYRYGKPALDYGNIRAELARRGIADPTPRQLRQVVIDIRQAKLPDPKVLGNAGSFFMNPVVGRSKFEELAETYPDMPHYHIDDEHEKIPAAWLIDRSGWRGRSLGRAGVHEAQALVLVNRGGADGSEVVELCRAIQTDVQHNFGISLKPEVNII